MDFSSIDVELVAKLLLLLLIGLGPKIALVVGLVLLVGALDYLLFTNIDRLASRLNPTSLVVSEVVFGILLTAVAVQLVVFGLQEFGIIEAAAGH